MLFDRRLNLAVLGEALSLLLFNSFTFLGGLLSLLALGSGNLLLAPAAERLAIMGLIPLTKWGGINLDNGGASQSIGADKLVI